MLIDDEHLAEICAALGRRSTYTDPEKQAWLASELIKASLRAPAPLQAAIHGLWLDFGDRSEAMARAKNAFPTA